jgi:L-2-amino-thiazoline-4-carboxylic acid hydrolase
MISTQERRKPMGTGPGEVSILTRREIEALMAAPFVQALALELGEERGFEVVRDIIESLARNSGADMATLLKGNTIAHFAKGLKYWMQDDALVIEVLGQTDVTFSFNVVRCRYAEMYKRIGLQHLGKHLSCARDYAFMKGFNPNIRLTRTKTIMEGAGYCDFRYQLVETATDKSK